MDFAIDFDGTIYSYTSGWQGATNLPDEPVPGAIPLLRAIINDPECCVSIFSVRNPQKGAVQAMRDWLLAWGLEPIHVREIRFPITKPPSDIFIDDRAVQFDGTYKTLEEYKNFKPWHKNAQK